jgi:hypothetical protein
MRLGQIYSHFPSGISIIIIVGLATTFFVFSYRKGLIDLGEIPILLFSGMISSAIVTNQHLITGKNIEFSSHYFLESVYWAILAIFYVLPIWLKRKNPSFQKIFFTGAVIAVIMLSIPSIRNILTMETFYGQGESYAQNYQPIFRWLNQNTKPEETVFANDSISYLVPIYTKENVFYSPYSILFFMPDTEVHKRFLINHFFDDIDQNFVLRNQRAIFGAFYTDLYGHNQSKNKIRKLFFIPTVSYDFVPQAKITNVLKEAKAIHNTGFEKSLYSFEADYLIWDTNKDLNWEISRFNNFQLMYSSNGIFIYKIKTKGI